MPSEDCIGSVNVYGIIESVIRFSDNAILVSLLTSGSIDIELFDKQADEFERNYKAGDTVCFSSLISSFDSYRMDTDNWNLDNGIED